MTKKIDPNTPGTTGLWISLFLSAILPMATGFVLTKLFTDWRWVHYPFHAMVESTGSLSALVIAVLMIILLRNGHLTRRYIMVACALIGMGLLDGFHSILHSGVTFVWLHSIATTVGGIMFAAVWLPETWITEKRQNLLILLTTSFSMLTGIVAISLPDILPTMVINGQFSVLAKFINISGGIGFLAGTVYFIHDYLRRHKTGYVERERTEDLVFANHCLLFGIAGLLFESSALWDAGWWWWHVLRFTAYFVVLVYFFILFKRGQDKLRTSEQRFRSINSRVPGIVYQFRIDANGNRSLPYVSPTVEKFIGLPADTVMENVEEWFALTHPDDLPGLESSIAESMKNMDIWEWEGRFIHTHGHTCWLHGSSTPYRRQDGSIVWDGVFIDITERKQAEAELDKYRHQLEIMVDERTQKLLDTQDELVRKERLATLGQLTATVSHELRNPLGAMRPSLYVIEKGCSKDDERTLKAIELINKNVDRCDNIIDELLDFTRITKLNRQPTRIDEWLESVLEEQNIPNNVQIEKDFSLENIELSVDSDRLRRAIINVVENACHAMIDNQQTNCTNQARLNITTKSNNGRIEIIISDTGTGIAKDVLNRIFEPLFSTKGFGVGLGMPTVKQIMEQHEGGIEIDSDEGKGTAVTLWLPDEAS